MKSSPYPTIFFHFYKNLRNWIWRIFSCSSPVLLLIFSWSSPVLLLFFSWSSPDLLLFFYCSYPVLLLFFSWSSPVLLLFFSCSSSVLLFSKLNCIFSSHLKGSVDVFQIILHFKKCDMSDLQWYPLNLYLKNNFLQFPSLSLPL